MGTTLDDLARLSGVSRATVSRVLNGGSASEETRRRVHEVMEQTGYRPNVVARSLATGRTGVIGVVLDVTAKRSIGDDYFSELLVSISDALNATSHGMMLWLGNRSTSETVASVVQSRLVDGVIVTSDDDIDPFIEGLAKAPFPAVFVGHRIGTADISYVDIDNRSAGETATKHLIDLGRKRIAHVQGRTTSGQAADRRFGYEKAMAEAGMSTDGLIVGSAFTRQAGAEAAALLLPKGVDAIFCASDEIAEGVLDVVSEAGLRVPEDVAVVGFDDIGAAAATTPPLTSIRQNLGMVGREAAGMLLALVEEPDRAPLRKLLPVELIVRQSSAGG